MSKGKDSGRPSSNWLALRKSLPSSTHHTPRNEAARKRRKLDHDSSLELSSTSGFELEPTSFRRGTDTFAPVLDSGETKNGQSIDHLRKMVTGDLDFSTLPSNPGKYLALDCEMVGVGIEGKESSLARVSLVNYHGVVQLDEFVRQREHVVDYRTEFSGVRASDMINAKPFSDIQKQVAKLLDNRILIGHAVYNDLKVLLLSHPRPLTRDTQHCAAKHKLTGSNRPALRHLVQQELGIKIQGGEHSSVTDARATMAVYRLHRKEWDKGRQKDFPANPEAAPKDKKRKRTDMDEDNTGEPTGGGRKGISSGLSTVVKYRGGGKEEREKKTVVPKGKGKWWTELAGESSSKAKGSVRVRV